jgi:two-component system, cell cycle sensor histidine kinase and response regulator CckA
VSRTLRILLVEDEEQDVPLLLRELTRAGHTVTHERVETEAGLRGALRRGPWDVVLTDFALPGWSGREALRLIRETAPEVPVVVVSGFIGEEEAASLMKAGASDFLVKDRLFRIAAVVEREVEDAEARRAQAQALARKNAELLQAQKMEVVGRLVGGVAHDFNNLLSVIMGFAQVMEKQTAGNERLHHPAEEIMKAAERAAQLTRRLLRISRKEVAEPRTFDLNAVVAGLATMLRRVIGEEIRMEVTLAPELPGVHADPGQIEQVILNLAVNARDAMPAGGQLRIETAALVRDRRSVVRLSVRDTGTGISPELRVRLFEPFFTTKEPDKGTGLGLATVQSIVTAAGGRIDVESEPGRGASFHVELPAAPAAAAAVDGDATAAGTQAAPVLASGTILVVEDDAPLCALLRHVLEDAGYPVVAARTREEAERAAAGRATALLLCDLVLADGTGSALYARLREHQPALRALFLSGYTDDEIRRARPPAGVLCVRKPVSPDELLARVRGVLAAAPPSTVGQV